MPSGLIFTTAGKGTATITGTPAAGTGGVYSFEVIATNGQGTPAVQHFTLTVTQAPAFTSAVSTTASVGKPFTFGIGTTGYPAATVTESGTLPTGVHFSAGTSGTATLSGDPTAGTGGVYQLKLKATNSAGSVTQTFTLTVDQPPAITSAATYSVKVAGTAKFKVTTTGYPAATLSLSTPLPNGLVFTTAGKGTATITGIPAAGTGGVYSFEVIATNGQGTPAVQHFTLTVTRSRRPSPRQRRPRPASASRSPSGSAPPGAPSPPSPRQARCPPGCTSVPEPRAQPP